MKIFVAMAAFSLFVLTVAEGRTQDVSYGEAEYRDSCAVCHGVDGRGDGPLADELQKRPTDLTRLFQKSGGAFPTRGSSPSSTVATSYLVTENGTCLSGAVSFLMRTSRSMDRAAAKSSPRSISTS